MDQGYLTPPDEVDLERGERAIRRASLIAFIALTAALALAWYLLPVWFEFPVRLPERLAFAAQASVLVLFCVLVGVGLVSTFRRRSPQDVGGSAAGPPSGPLAIRVAFLQNTLEQAVLAVGLYFALATLLTGDRLVVIPVAVAFFVIGRVLFLQGYARGVEGRALGMVMTMLPTILGYLLAIVLLVWRIVT